MLPLLSVLAVLAAAVVVCTAGSEDATLIPEASGSEVVEATLARLQVSCVFPDDKLLMRRMAFVESSDGQEKRTFRDGYHGGIWQVDEAMYEITKSPDSETFLKLYIKQIEEDFDIDWYATSWEDLRMSLYSAIGSKMYVLYSSRDDRDGIPREIDAQADFWVKYYRPEGKTEDYIEGAEHLEQGCHGVGVDMVFVLDGSNSVEDNFDQITQFTKDVIDGFDIGKDETRVGMIQYATDSEVQFHLNTFFKKRDMMKEIDNIKHQGGWTFTDKALDQMLSEAFTEANGARPLSAGYPRVAIVLTDGESTDPPQTIEEAMKVHDSEITVFAIGVGKELNMEELTAIASEPTCMHLILLDDFEEVESLSYTIQDRTCDAPIIVGPGENGTEWKDLLPPGFDQNCKIKIPIGGATVKFDALTGSANYYLAHDTYPSAAYHEEKIEATPDHPAVLFIEHSLGDNAKEEESIFCKIIGDLLNRTDLLIGLRPGNDDHCEDHLCVNGECIDTGDSYICVCDDGFKGEFCDEAEQGDCGPHGTCLCLCDPGWTGANCDKEIDDCEDEDHCASDPCVRGDCVNTNDVDDGYLCVCPVWYTGRLCDIYLNPCMSAPCGPYGNCTYAEPDHGHSPDFGDYHCNCFPGFTGEHCERTEADPCDDHKCIHGICEPVSVIAVEEATHAKAGGTDMPSPYVCLCDETFTGRHCDVPIEDDDECLDSDEEGNSSDSDESGDGSGGDSGEDSGGSSGDSGEETYDCEASNPCTDENIGKGDFYHAYHDESSFVQCDEHGGCFVRDCPEGTVWDQDALTCVHARGRKQQDDVMGRIDKLKRLLDELNAELEE